VKKFTIYAEIFWKSLKYEKVYIKTYDTVKEAIFSIEEYIWDYNSQSPHSSLNDKTPAEMYFNLNTSADNFVLI